MFAHILHSPFSNSQDYLRLSFLFLPNDISEQPEVILACQIGFPSLGAKTSRAQNHMESGKKKSLVSVPFSYNSERYCFPPTSSSLALEPCFLTVAEQIP